MVARKPLARVIARVVFKVATKPPNHCMAEVGLARRKQATLQVLTQQVIEGKQVSTGNSALIHCTQAGS